jgi:hypothetical protein
LGMRYNTGVAIKMTRLAYGLHIEIIIAIA